MIFAALQHDIAFEDPLRTRAMVEGLLEGSPPPRGSFLLLPELGDTGFSFDLDRVCGTGAVAWAASLAAAYGIHLQVGHAERGPDGRGRNRATLISPDGEVRGDYDKVHPFSFAGEERHFSSGTRLLLAEAGPFTVCPMICYDLRFPELWRIAARNGAEVFTIGAEWLSLRFAQFLPLLIARAIENQAFVVACNRVGTDPRFRYLGGSVIISPTGEILARGGDAPQLVSADLDAGELAAIRREFPVLADLRGELLGSIEIERVAADRHR